MNTHTLYIESQDAPAAIERLLRTTRHRGFAIRELHLQAEDDAESVTIRLTVSGDRPLQLLTRQLAKLVDVTAIDVKASLTTQLTNTA